MSTIVFLAPVKGTGTVVYGKDHAAAFDGVPNETQVRQWQAEGKAALTVVEARNVRITALAATTATISFTTDQPAVGMLANYGTTTATSSSQNATPTAGVGDIVVNLTGLTTATLYYYKITTSVAGVGYTITPLYTFTTL